jgi:DNA-directed RNA polymerase subunit RPC12/RpoP
MHVIDGKYQEKKVTRVLRQAYLTIYVVSNSGKNIAGVCTLDMAALTTEQWQTMDKQLERCPDRNARIVMKIRSSFVREVEDTPS